MDSVPRSRGLTLASLAFVPPADLHGLMPAVAACARVRASRRGVSSAKEFGDRLRDKGAARREALERSTSANLVRSVSARAEATVKENVDIDGIPLTEIPTASEADFEVSGSPLVDVSEL